MSFSNPMDFFKRTSSLLALAVMLVTQTGCPSNPPQSEGQVEATTDGGNTEKTSVDKRQCAQDSECPTEQPRCNNGFCEPVPPQCQQDSDCNDPNKVCQSGQCVNKSAECTTDADCASKAPKTKCDAATGTCVEPQQPECTTDADCASKAPKTKCDTATNTCVEPAPNKCTSNNDCTDPSLPLCNTATGSCEGCPAGQIFCTDKCVDPQVDNANCGACGNACGAGSNCTAATCQSIPKPCQSDADCAATEICDANGTCVPKGGCQSDADCKDPALPVCDVTRGVCGSAPPECTTDGDCANKAPKTKCDATGTCVEPPPECQADADCKDPAKPVCVQGKCGPASGCRSNADCTTDPAKKACDVTDGQCYACVASTDCLSYQECDSGTRTCQLKAGFCVIDTDCKADPSKPVCVSNACVECKVKADCKVQFDCQANKCAFVGCAADNECAAPTPHCKVADKKCVVCTTNAHCTASQVCNTTTNVCEAKPDCTTDADCASSTIGKFCNTTAKKCVECLTATNCTNNRQCQGNVCVECTQDSDCNAGQICNASKCVAGCRRDRDCPANQICDTQKLSCTPGCRSDADCSNNYSCQGNLCVATCNSTQDCFNASGSAPQCQSQADCSSDSVCSNGRCRALACRTTPTPARCVVCTQNSDCQRYGQTYQRLHPACLANNTCGCSANTQCTAFNAGAVGGVCDTAKSECVGCKADTDCRRGYICNSTTALCEIGCRTDNECPSSQYCVNTKCVECKTNSNCTTDPTKTVCGADGSCVGCAANTDCKTAGKTVCLASVCVQCTQDSHCSGATNKCDLISNTCYNPAQPTQCQPCGANNSCATGHRCVQYRTQGSNTTRETMCAKTCQRDSDCAKGFTCGPRIGQFDLTTVQGACYPAYSFSSGSSGNVRYITCTALTTQGKACTSNGQCGVSNFEDSYCDSFQGNTCRVTCRFDNSNTCPTGYTCACPAGFQRDSNTTCQGSNNGQTVRLRATCVR
ncbi:MAG: hypothetical protein H6728_09715 [Myxococcales bacterium]|nr:hypothetical protein [Myxococcales bacterium]